ncbi:MAG TPA: bifunctional 4-hydroxy-2-oxoglutarate aldolase/2-dehydro-3-deoxy-phosphogluconate aldolase [Pseudomonadales bacterium]|nr:bifunctional 4-hydroxy-2-oxoglutarate aldolase/2-dehydro-3-deoxy-phosphogluconate aldolase [Pseudomonadales bacterium]
MDLTIEQLLRQNPLIPVVTIADPVDAVPLATALVEGGIHIIEITLRSDAALSAIGEIRAALPSMTVGCGTVRGEADLDHAIDAGAHFAVSPGTPSTLLLAAARRHLPFLPAGCTPGEFMTLVDAGFTCIKFFPASAMGGITALAAFAGPLPEVSFCPSGGVNSDNFTDYLALKNVAAVSGSWIAPATCIASRDWKTITHNAADSLRRLQ